MVRETPLISVVLPVYNREKYLDLAIKSVLAQTYSNWELVICDDCSSQPTLDLLGKYQSHPQIIINYNPENLGLFKNLNLAIAMGKGALVIILCSDDYLLPECLETNLNLYLIYECPSLLLSSYTCIDQNGKSLKIDPYPECAQKTRLWESSELIPLLLKYGSINGNISGMFFSKQTFEAVGKFRDDWSHAADWEWIYRVASLGSILISRSDVAVVRCHSEQLSGTNFQNISNSLEVIEMVQILLQDPYLQHSPQAREWALYMLQYHLWYALKFVFKGEWGKANQIIKAISQVTGITATLWQLLKWLPTRWQIFRKKISLPM